MIDFHINIWRPHNKCHWMVIKWSCKLQYRNIPAQHAILWTIFKNLSCKLFCSKIQAAGRQNGQNSYVRSDSWVWWTVLLHSLHMLQCSPVWRAAKYLIFSSCFTVNCPHKMSSILRSIKTTSLAARNTRQARIEDLINLNISNINPIRFTGTVK